MSYWKFVATGCLLGLFIEIEFRILGKFNPGTMCFAIVCYPIFVSLAYLASRVVDRFVRHQPLADVVHYVGSGIFGLAVEWTLLGNSPWGNPKAIQPAMFCMCAAFCFGPRVLLRHSDQPSLLRKLVWHGGLLYHQPPVGVDRNPIVATATNVASCRIGLDPDYSYSHLIDQGSFVRA